MKSLTLACFAITAAFSAGAHAADYAPGMPNLITFNESGDWSGFYVGAHAGYGSLDTQDSLGLGNENLETPIGGIHGGFSTQFGFLTLGLESDLTLTRVREDADVPFADVETDWLASIRTRVGYAFDRIHVFGTAGLTVAHVEVTSNVVARSQDEIHTGYVVGGGAEFLLAEDWVVGAEYLRYELRPETYTLNSTFQSEGNFDVVRARLSYTF